jgi:hypothetical protein
LAFKPIIFFDCICTQQQRKYIFEEEKDVIKDGIAIVGGDTFAAKRTARSQ